MRKSRTRRLLACATAVTALFAIQASAASAVITIVNPGSTNVKLAASTFTFSPLQGSATYTNVSCSISGGQWQNLGGGGFHQPSWFGESAAPPVSCPGSGLTWLTGGGWPIGVQGSLSGNHTALIKIPSTGLRVTLPGCGQVGNTSLVTLNAQWIDGAGMTDAKVRFNQDTLVPVWYTGNPSIPGCASLGNGGARNLVIRAGSEWKVSNYNNTGAFQVSVY